jgi:hypothetical protein
MPDYAGYIWEVLLNDPSAYVPEIVGLAIIAGFIGRFEQYRPKRAKAFGKTGRLPQVKMAIAHAKN